MNTKFVIAIRDATNDRSAGFLKDYIFYKGSQRLSMLATTSIEQAMRFDKEQSVDLNFVKSVRFGDNGFDRPIIPDFFITNMGINEDGQLDFCDREYFDGKYPIPRGEWQEYFCSLDEKCCGWSRSPRENDTFYYKSEAEDTIWDKDGNYQPNFIYKPTGFKMCWYKYPLRSCYANRDIDFDSFKKMIDACVESLKTQPLKECEIEY